jgi:pimeloyl-ACP methyl ester carboxylesterase
MKELVMKRLKVTLGLIIISLLLSLAGCSAQLTQKGFIAQDDIMTSYSTEQWREWQLKYTVFELEPILIKVAENTEEAVVLQGIFFDHPNSNEIIYFLQGNGMTVSNSMASVMESLIKLNKDIVIFDRRGTGASNGVATINNLITDASEQFDFIEQQLSPDKIIIHGFSLGSFIAGQVAKEKTPDALILQGSATNVDEWIDARMPWYSKIFLSIEVDPAFYQVDNKVVLAKHYKNPLLIIAGENDQQAPAELSRRLYEVSQSTNKQLMVVDNAGHSNMLDKNEEIVLYQQFLANLNTK